MSINLDPRLSKVISAVGIIFSGVITWAICWSAAATVDLEKQMVGVQKDIAALVARPEGISRQEYTRDATRWDTDIDGLKHERRGRER